MIVEAISRLGCKWRAVAALLPGRSDDAVRNRWARLLREGCVAAPADGIVKAKANRVPPKDAKPKPAGAALRQCWTAEEDALILATVAELGSKWARIASLMPQRTEHGVRNRYNRLMLLAAERQAAAPPTGA